MSFVDLATLALHRRTEMEDRIRMLHTKCDQAIRDLQKLKTHTHGFIDELNCDHAHLKDKFLKYMKQLDELNYLVTEFNISLGQLDMVTPPEPTPVHDIAPRALLLPTQFNLMDALIEPSPSTSAACSALCPPEKLLTRKKISKKDQLLIAFSSSSSSSESMASKRLSQERGTNMAPGVETNQMAETELAGQFNLMNIEGAGAASVFKLPPQTVLEENKYRGLIMHVDGGQFWAILDDLQGARRIMFATDEYYKKERASIPEEEVKPVSYCVYYDGDTDAYYRALLLVVNMNKYEIYLVDTGEHKSVGARDVFPMVAPFWDYPPQARCCYLAGVDMLCNTNPEAIEETDQYLRQFVGLPADIIIDDNTSDVLGVYVMLDDSDVSINKLLVQSGLATEIDKPQEPSPRVQSSVSSAKRRYSPMVGPPELLPNSASGSDITEQAEYDDPVEAVMGYRCRDNEEICKHYTGGPEKTCFKGRRCNKRHVPIHPDGWTLDQMAVPVVSKLKPFPLPMPGSTIRVKVMCVCHFDRLWVQIPQEYGDSLNNEVRAFGDIRPLTTLKALERDMNCDATRQAYKPLKIAPAPGELVAARYTDDSWYRAKVVETMRADQCVKVMYIDYGNMMWVKEDAIKVLEPRFTALPIQAVLCRLGSVGAVGDESTKWAEARQALEEMTLNKVLEADVLARDYDELTIELYDEATYSVAQQMAARGLVTYTEFAVQDDSQARQSFSDGNITRAL